MAGFLSPTALAARVSWNLCQSDAPLGTLGYPDPCWWSADRGFEASTQTITEVRPAQPGQRLLADSQIRNGGILNTSGPQVVALPAGTWYLKIRGDPYGRVTGSLALAAGLSPVSLLPPATICPARPSFYMHFHVWKAHAAVFT